MIDLKEPNFCLYTSVILNLGQDLSVEKQSQDLWIAEKG